MTPLPTAPESPSPAEAPDLLYLVPDVTDPAVSRRVTMLTAGGAKVSTVGFRRGSQKPVVEEAVVLGQTFDAALAQRGLAVFKVLLRPWHLAGLVRGHQILIARNLEMLLIARLAMALGNRRARLIYECLDVHGMMLGNGATSRMLRGLEGFLLRRVNLLVVSSPAFVREYFEPQHPNHPPVLLVENKLVRLDPIPEPHPAGPRSPPPWRIGWFGMIRCRRSLDMLKRLTATNNAVEVIIRGRPTAAVFSNFEQEIASTPRIRFEGPYAAADLPAFYSEVDFVWTMDFYEEGQNSSWLLPNRLYEGGAFNKPALAETKVESGRWLSSRRSGVTFGNPDAELASFFMGLGEREYLKLAAAVQAVPRDDLICDRAACRRLVETLSH